MGSGKPTTVRELLLTRRGVAFLASSGAPLPEDQLRAVEIELGDIGYVMSARLTARLARCSLDELVAFRSWALATLLAHVGGDRKHEPLFRRFPRDIPPDTLDLWWRKVLVHFLQAEGQPCLFCRRVGTTHVLNPCCHVVCDRCFDGANYSACPCCEHHVDRTSPFFQPNSKPAHPGGQVVFKLLDLAENLSDETRALFVSLCERKQAMSPGDRDALATLLVERKSEVLGWLPRTIPVRENVAIVFGTLFKVCGADEVLPHARRFMTTATDVLRFVAVLSGTDGSLLPETIFKHVDMLEGPSRFWGKLAELIGVEKPGPRRTTVTIPLKVRRFKTAKLPRSLRRALLSILEGLEPARLVEDMLRHRSYWVWLGEFLHPHEYAARFPQVARAFQIIRKQSRDGTRAPVFESWNARLERCASAQDSSAMLILLGERPGELARRLDHVLRVARSDLERERVIATFLERVPGLATPVLVTLRHHLPGRLERAGVRVYWPKGRIALGVSAPDERMPLAPAVVQAALPAIDAELLRRFASKPAFAECVIDESLRSVIAPFNERTASRSAVSLPRGSHIAVPQGKVARLFLHWCQPALNGHMTDLDLSVGLYGERWNYLGVCSYYELQARSTAGALLAQSAGDLRDAPWPDGATEFVDLHCEVALAAGVRYAVMVVNNYGGMPFSLLERGFAGLMLRDDPEGKHFDPRSVELKFALAGQNGVFLPLVLDLREGVLHWLDVHAKGQLRMNNVETSRSAIARLCPEQMLYFGSGVRASMFDVALLHAAARCQRVFLRGHSTAEFLRRPGEGAVAFHERLTRGGSDEPRSRLPSSDGSPLLAFLFRGDVDLPAGSSAYTLFRDRVVPSLTASDLLS